MLLETETEAEYVRTSLFSTARSEALLRPSAARDTGFQTGSDNDIKVHDMVILIVEGYYM